jgi:hypothetical protein
MGPGASTPKAPTFLLTPQMAVEDVAPSTPFTNP